jgi:CheY-like chemotaxis protein
MLAPGTPALEDVIEIRRAGERARELTMQLLAFARRQVVVPRIFDVAAQLRAVQRFLERVVGEDVALRVDAPEGTGAVCMDPVQFEQLLLNLAVNARDAMPGGGALTIRTSHVTLTGDEAAACGLESADCVQVEVEDTGSGMTTEVLQRVFEPFFTTKELGYGTGLGLSLVYGAARQAGGEVLVRSVVGAGTTFTVLLPWVPHVAPQRAADAAPAVERGREVVLVVEDDDHVRRVTTRLLAGAGYTCSRRPTGARALDLTEGRTDLDLVVTDVVMPHLGGPGLAAELCPTHPGLRVTYTTGYLDEARRAQVGSAPLLPKPYLPATLLRFVRAALDA